MPEPCMMLTPLLNDHALQLLTVHYAEPGRFYHGTAHLLDVMRLWAHYAREGAWDSPIEAGVALAYHDAFYEPGNADNEKNSAAMAAVASRLYPGSAERVAELVLATARHTEDFECDDDMARVLDIDVAGIGRPWRDYETNGVLIRREFDSVPEDAWNKGRRAFLEAMLRRDSIYRLEPPPGSSEEQAQANLERDLESTEAPDA